MCSRIHSVSGFRRPSCWLRGVCLICLMVCVWSGPKDSSSVHSTEGWFYAHDSRALIKDLNIVTRETSQPAHQDSTGSVWHADPHAASSTTMRQDPTDAPYRVTTHTSDSWDTITAFNPADAKATPTNSKSNHGPRGPEEEPTSKSQSSMKQKALAGKALTGDCSSVQERMCRVKCNAAADRLAMDDKIDQIDPAYKDADNTPFDPDCMPKCLGKCVQVLNSEFAQAMKTLFGKSVTP